MPSSKVLRSVGANVNWRFRHNRREVAMNNMAKLPFELSVPISRARLKPHRGTGIVEC